VVNAAGAAAQLSIIGNVAAVIHVIKKVSCKVISVMPVNMLAILGFWFSLPLR